ncbi:unnamed protein product [Dicrocoelium dendriticum]|nr:unnamed protein product [Dicrocoelium dendriticum]
MTGQSIVLTEEGEGKSGKRFWYEIWSSTLQQAGILRCGCQIALAQFSRNATFQSHINVFIALAPVAYLGNVESPIRIIAPLAQKMEYVLRLFNHGEFLPSSDLLTFLGKLLCTEGHAPIVCKNIIYLIAGYDAGNTNVTRLPVYIAHTPAGTSTKNMVHYCQASNSPFLHP